MYGRGGSSSRGSGGFSKREFSPPRRSSTSHQSPSYNHDKNSNGDKYGGFLRKSEGHSRRPPPSNHHENFSSSRGNFVSNKDDLIQTKAIPKCPDLISRGICSRVDCKYSHEETKDLVDLTQTVKCKLNESLNDPGIAGKVESLLHYQFCHVSNYFLHFKPGFQENPDSYRKWIMAMLERITTESTGFFRHFQNNDVVCLQIFQTLVRAEYSATAGPPSRKCYYSFQRCLVPLLFLLSHSEMESSPMHNLTNQIYSIFQNGLVQFSINFLACSMECLTSKSLEDKQCSSKKALEFDAGTFIPYSFAQIFFPFVKFLSVILNRFSELIYTNQTRQLIEALDKSIQEWRKSFTEKALPTLESEFSIFMVEKTLQPIKNRANEMLDITDTILAKRNKEKERQLLQYQEDPDQWPDGPLEAPAGAHDNDFVDFKKVRVIPTMCEILSPHAPTLPGNQLLTPYAHWLSPGPLRLLDTHFRLLRHDMFCSIQMGVKAVLQNLQQFQSSMRYKQRLGYHQVDVMVYTDLNLHQLDFDYMYGSCLSIWFQLPKFAKSRDQLSHFFKNCLLRDGLVAVIRTPTKSEESTKIFFATVVTKNDQEKNIQRGYSTVSLHFVDEGVQTTWMQSRATYLMVEVRGILFESYRPILHALQSIEPSNVPFTNILCSQTPLGKIAPPCYMRSGQFKYDLSFLASKDSYTSANLEFSAMDVDVLYISEHLVKNTTLDKSQATAVIAALSQEVCCIQGPPGTGKSFLGVKVMQVLCNPLQNICFPILIMTYTNHALDQFLEALLDEGIKSIVRLGSKVSGRLQDYQLRNLKGSRTCYVMRKELEEKIRKLEEKIMGADRSSGIERKKDFWRFLSRVFSKQCRFMASFCQHVCVQDYIGYWLSSMDLNWRNKKAKKKRKILKKFDELFISSSEEEQEESHEDLDLYPSVSLDVQKSRNEEKEWNIINDKILNSYTERLNLSNSEDIRTQKSAKPALSELLKVEDVWTLTQNERNEVHSFWLHIYEVECGEKNESIQQTLKQLLVEYRELNDQYSLNDLKTKKIIGMTTTSCAKNIHLIQALQPKVIIVEEAGEVLEAHILASLGQWVQHLILIGDHLQLRPRVQEYSLNVDSIEGKKYRLNESLFERLMQVPNFPKYRLTSQRRMRGPLISQFIRQITYPDLEDGENTKTYPDVKGIKKNVFFLDHGFPQTSGEESFSGQSHSNMYEVDMIVAMTVYFLQQGYKPNQLVILTPYVGQLIKIREALSLKNLVSLVDNRDLLMLDLAFNKMQNPNGSQDSLFEETVAIEEKNLSSCIRVSSIDNYQGEEADVVLISLVRSFFENGTDKGIGFLSIENRINVMLSRARHGMFILGNAGLMERKSKVWCKVIQLLREQELLGPTLPIICETHPEMVRHINSPDAFAVEAPDGGCLLRCVIRLSCGHECDRHCHSDDINHKLAKCRKPCLRIHEICNHPCPKLCFEKCGVCETSVSDIILKECGHVYPNTKCFEAKEPSELKCEVRVERERTCGHMLFVECFKDVNQQMCPTPCNDQILPCGHKCEKSCSTCNEKNISKWFALDHGKCTHPCGLQLSCRHICKVLCCEHPKNACPPCKEACLNTCCEHGQCKNLCSDPCVPCMEKCTWSCEHEAQCPLPCGAPCIRFPCDRRCKKRLECGHVCPSLCGEPCPDKKFCHECSNEEIRSTPVDLFLPREYHEIDVNETPILVFPCNHFFTYGTLDMYFEISKYYRQLGNQFVDVKPFDVRDEVRLLACPNCRLILQSYHVRRYSRIMKQAVLNVNDQHYALKLNEDSKLFETYVNDFPQNLRASSSSLLHLISSPEDSLHEGDTKKKYLKLFRGMEHCLKNFILSLKANPSRRVYNAMHNFVIHPSMNMVQKKTGFDTMLRLQEKLIEALKKTRIIRTYFVEEGKAYLLLHQLYRFFFIFRTESLLNDNVSTSTIRISKSTTPENISFRALTHCFNKANHFVEQSIDCFEKGKANLRIFQAHLRFFGFLLEYLEVFFKLRKGRFFIYLSPKQQETWYALVDKKVDDVKPKLEAMKRLAESLNYHDDDPFLEKFMKRFQEIKASMRRNSELEKCEIGLIISAMSSKFGSTSGHFYACPNGHLYRTGNCGEAMEGSFCPDCYAPIGGGGHTIDYIQPNNHREDALV